MACGSGFSREAGTAVDGTGFARVRGQARSHRDRVDFKVCTLQLPPTKWGRLVAPTDQNAVLTVSDIFRGSP